MRTILAVLALAGALSACVPVIPGPWRVAAAAQGASARDVTRYLRASWYDCAQPRECSRAKRTANGERFNPDGLTAAHRTLPFGTLLRVCHRGRCVVCRINDRGPFIQGRSIDLARGTARAIGMSGVALVTIERI